MQSLISGYNKFPRIYKMIQAVADGDMGQIKVPDTESAAGFAAEAGNLLTMLDKYMEITPNIPGMTKNKTYEAFARLETHYGFVVWTNRMMGTAEDMALHMVNEPDMPLTKAVDRSWKAHRESLEALRKRFEQAFAGKHIVLKGYSESWSGTVSKTIDMDSISELFEYAMFKRAFDADAYSPCITLFITTDGDLKLEYGRKEDEYIDEYTFYDEEGQSVVPALEKYFGWDHKTQPHAVVKYEDGAFILVDYR